MVILAKPVPGSVTSPYGWRGTGTRRNFHNGIDFGWMLTSPVKSRRVVSPVDGVVVESGFSALAGNYVFIRPDSDDSYRVRCIHFASRAVSVGDRVWVGRFVGVMGDTGLSTKRGQIHLHLDLFHNGARIDPAPHIRLPFPGELAFADLPTLPLPEKEDDVIAFVKVKGQPTVRVTGGGYRYEFQTAAELDAFRAILTNSGHDVPPVVEVPSSFSFNLMWNAVPAPAVAGGSVDLKPVLDAVAGVPTKTVDQFKDRL